jgi:hypothetical protein
MNRLQTKLILLAGLVAIGLQPRAWADTWNHKTIFTFSEAIEIPGQVLPAGTYVFKLANSNSNRNIVQVFDKSETRIFGTFLAIPDYRLRASDKSIIRFEERPAGAPQAVKAWFYPGKTYGHEFVYPKTTALALAKANNTPVPSMPAELEPELTKPAMVLLHSQILAFNAPVLKAEEPDGKEVELAYAFPDPSGATPAALPDKLPSTASPLPLIGMIGLLSLGLSATMRVAVRKVK